MENYRNLTRISGAREVTSVLANSKYLGVVVDTHINFKEHIQQLSKKISWGTGILATLRHNISLTILKQMYFSLICPFPMCGATIWGNTQYVTTLHPDCIA